MRYKLFITTIFLGCFFSIVCKAQKFVKVNNGQFLKDNKTYHYLGTNFWYGMNLAISDKDRLIRELDRLQQLSITNLRIMATSEGDKDDPWGLKPTLQSEPGKFNEELLIGLDVLLDEMGKRDMLAVVCLNNFWQWSGGFSKYVSWANNNEDIPYPPPAKDGDWGAYQDYATKFYDSKKAQKWYQNTVELIINRVNTINGKYYKDDTTIMSWQLANEPVGGKHRESYLSWINKTASFIKKLDANHLVSIGSEGNTPSKKNGTNFEEDHLSENIDYLTFHLWVQNWGWYDPNNTKSYSKAIGKASQYILDHVNTAVKINKPIVLEEFGISRDDNNYSVNSSIEYRNKYYKFIFDTFLAYGSSIKNIAGVNFWAWGGEGRPADLKSYWKLEDDFIGDPPHELQGWYSIYDTDLSSLLMIGNYAEKFNQLDRIKQNGNE